MLIAAETTELLDGTDVEAVWEMIDFEQLRIETLKLVRLTYSLDAYNIDRYLRSYWSERQIYLY